MNHFIMINLLFLSSIAFGNDLSKYPYNTNLEEITGIIVPPGYKPSVNAYRSSGSTLPESFDWRTSGLTPIENQGQCGSCYAFATTAVLQDVIKLRTGKTLDLSEQYLVDCSYKNGDSYGCSGGWALHDYHMDRGKEYQGGIEARLYPYTAQNGYCRTGLMAIDYLTSWREVSNDINSIKEAIYRYGPVWTTLYADNSFWQYQGGYYCGPSSQVNHAVTLVGWTKRGWILKNSWSENWGERGYMEIGYGCNSVGFGTSHIIYRDDSGPNPPPPDPPEQYCSGEQQAKSKYSLRKVNMTIANVSKSDVEIFWLDHKGKRVSYGKLPSNMQFTVGTYTKHVFVAVDYVSRLCLNLKKINSERDKYWKIE